MCAGKFRGDVDPKEGLHPANCRNPRDRRVLEFLMPILYPEKPKRISLTMANTLFEALSGIRPMNWALLIHKIVGRPIPQDCWTSARGFGTETKMGYDCKTIYYGCAYDFTPHLVQLNGTHCQTIDWESRMRWHTVTFACIAMEWSFRCFYPLPIN